MASITPGERRELEAIHTIGRLCGKEDIRQHFAGEGTSSKPSESVRLNASENVDMA